MLEYKFDTQLLIEGEGLDEDAIHDYIMANIPGDCLLAIGDENLIKIHFHTNTPWKVLEYCASLGEIHDIVVENMELQAERWEEWAADDSLKHVVFVSYMLDDEDLMYSLSVFAAQNGMTVNYFNYSCQTIRSLAAEDLIDEMVHVREDTLYIYKGTDEGLCINTRMEYEEMDGVIVGTVK